MVFADKIKGFFSKIPHTFYTTKYMVCRLWKEREGRSYVFTQLLRFPFNIMIPILYTVLPGMLINELTGQRRTYAIFFYCGVLVAMPILNQFVSRYTNVKLEQLYMSLDTIFTAEYFAQSVRLDYELLEDPDTQMKCERAYDMVGAYPIMVQRIQNLITALTSLIAYSTIIVMVNPLVILLILIIIFVNSVTTRLKNERVRALELEQRKYMRFTGSIRNYFTNIDFAKELRAFDLSAYFIDLFKLKAEKVNEMGGKTTKTEENSALVGAALNSLQQAVLYGYLIVNVLSGRFAIGDMTICMSAVNQFAGALRSVMEHYMFFEQMSPQIQDLIDYYSIESRLRRGGAIPHFDEHSTIEFKNVSFRYPGSDSYALKDLSLTVNGREKLCIVGANGSGKSTFIKLLTRLYLPTDGEILLNGVNINEYDYEAYQALFSPVYQDFCLYTLTLKENIVLNNGEKPEKFDGICRRIGLSGLIEKLPKKAETPVSKWEYNDGFTPSGGEAQKIAMARAVYKGGSVFLLDEPTAALDPVAEYEMYTNFHTVITGKCAILITHRLSAVQLSDKVAVFDAGRLVEYGTHNALYAQGGLYSQMFDHQAKFYRDDPNSEGEVSENFAEEGIHQ